MAKHTFLHPVVPTAASRLRGRCAASCVPQTQSSPRPKQEVNPFLIPPGRASVSVMRGQAAEGWAGPGLALLGTVVG